jgi:hypothetical protein
VHGCTWLAAGFDDPIEASDSRRQNTLREAVAYLAKSGPKMPAVPRAAAETLTPPFRCVFSPTVFFHLSNAACNAICIRIVPFGFRVGLSL